MYDAVLYIRWEENENLFYDECGFRINNVFEMITPNDLYLFRHDCNQRCFPYKKDKRILCEIIIEE